MRQNIITYCGFVSIIGRTNVGKSTLFNGLVKKNISIVSDKPKTTQYHILGVNTTGQYQIIYEDRPGVVNFKKKFLIDKYYLLNNSIFIPENNLLIFVIEGVHWKYGDEFIAKILLDIKYPIILVINKVDKIIDKKYLLPYIKYVSSKINISCVFPMCAKNNSDINSLTCIVKKFLPRSKHYFSKYYITNYSKEFMASEIIREKLMWFLYKELPYILNVKIQSFIKKSSSVYYISALIIVNSIGQKKIVIGSHGSRIKIIGTIARRQMKSLFKKDIILNLWVTNKIC